MTDLNDWRLTYDGAELLFGTYATGYPFTKQVDVGTAELRTGDVPHPSADGALYGLDVAGGRTLTFEVGIEKVRSAGEVDRWHPNLDALESFTARWAARRLRRRVGAVAELANLDRQRVTYGRPRNLKPRLDVVRKGWSELVCDFVTVDDLFYGLEPRETVLGMAAGEAGAFVFPIAFPWATAGGSSTVSTVANLGTEDTWPTLEVQGPVQNPSVVLLDGNGGVMWELRVDGVLAYDQRLVLDTRPWARGATINGQPASGRIRGDALDECQVPPGVWQVRYQGVDTAGTSRATIRLRDAFASL